ncbi:cupin domain-containing protein [Virgibacillus sp. CBA3643]|uniref:cupin domain-containing protein n=1 Tax=Virgibacillus sp. CBA3643 TaxID=2942278 RepID=UPI0035A38045
MGANIKMVKLQNAFGEDETSRIPKNFIKGNELNSISFNSCDHGTYFTGGGVAAHNHIGIEEIFYFIRGTGIVILDDEEIPVKAGSVVVVPPETYHAIKNTGEDVLQHVVCSAHV